jgi:ribonuclease-3
MMGNETAKNNLSASSPTELVNELEQTLNVRFNDKNLLMQALTHRSLSSSSDKGNVSNERLEFLGDSVLSFIVAEYLYKKYPDASEGELSRMKSSLVSGKVLHKWAAKISIGKYIQMSLGEELAGGRNKKSILINAYEALLGAIFLDQGIEKVKNIIHENLSQEKIEDTDYKSRLQEFFQKNYKSLPVYNVVKEIGPDHDKIFVIEIRFNNETIGVGSGKSKKEAEHAAAKNALQELLKGDL